MPFYLIKSAFRPNFKFYFNFDLEVPKVVFFPLYYKEAFLNWKNNLVPIWYYKNEN